VSAHVSKQQNILSRVSADTEFVSGLATEANKLDFVHATATGSYIPGDRAVGAWNIADAQYWRLEHLEC